VTRARRLLSYAAAAVAGLAATFFIAAPASAHNALITVDSVSCDKATGDRLITWSVNDDNFGQSTTWRLTTITFTPAPGAGAITGDLTTTGVDKSVNSSFTGVQRVPGNTSSVSLSVAAHWSDGADNDGTKVKSLVDVPPCKGVPNVTATSNCDGTLTIHLGNTGTAPLTFTLSSQNATVTVNGGESKDVQAPGNKDVTVSVQGFDDFVLKFVKPDNCPTATPTPSPSPTLPVTGGHLTGTLSIAAGLLVLGAGLIVALFVFRRRRTIAAH
jgi:hypothetical protein